MHEISLDEPTGLSADLVQAVFQEGAATVETNLAAATHQTRQAWLSAGEPESGDCVDAMQTAAADLAEWQARQGLWRAPAGPAAAAQTIRERRRAGPGAAEPTFMLRTVQCAHPPVRYCRSCGMRGCDDCLPAETPCPRCRQEVLWPVDAELPAETMNPALGDC